MASLLEITSGQKLFGGALKYGKHPSTTNKCDMSFAIFIPPKHTRPIPYLLFLSGLTCTAENFATKSGAFKKAAELGIAILIPDTSPRGDNVANDESYDLGQGAGFYLNATQQPWVQHFQMEDYIINELIPNAQEQFNLDPKHKAISGHSMGGHGALTLYYKHPEAFMSCSAFSPIVAPSTAPWGKKAFSAYLGTDETTWNAHDACQLVAHAPKEQLQTEILIDQGLADNFLKEQLKPERFEQACKKFGQKLRLRRHEGYDHSYFFIQTFIDAHLDFHFKHIF